MVFSLLEVVLPTYEWHFVHQGFVLRQCDRLEFVHREFAHHGFARSVYDCQKPARQWTPLAQQAEGFLHQV